MDIFQYINNDIELSTSGDLQTIDSVVMGQQRILRRLLTVPGTYIFHPTYGAGIQLFVGQPLNTPNYQKILGLILTQMQLEESVSKSPSPQISLQIISNGIFVNINYTDAGTSTPQVLTFTVQP